MQEGSGSAINLLFSFNLWINSLLYPVLLVYLTANLFIFPMNDVIGTFGCLVIVQFLDVFIRYSATKSPYYLK